MNNLHTGFARINVTPMLGIELEGYCHTRLADKVLDDLEINAIAFACEDKKAVILCLDHNGVEKETMRVWREHISQETGIPTEAIFITVSHCHNAPLRESASDSPLIKEYYQFLYRKMADAAKLALADLKPSRMGYAVGQAPNVAFVRRFRMKNGSVRTNPGVNNPEIDSPIGTPDERVGVLRFDRENAETLVLVNFANHPDTVGTSAITADWCGALRRTVEKALDNTKCMFINGAEGDVNHVNVHPTAGFLNGLKNDFDDVARGYEHAKYIGRVITGGVLQVFDKVEYMDVDCLDYLQKTIKVPANLPKKEELPNARRIWNLHQEGKDDEIGESGMMLTTVVYEAERMLRLENAPECFDMELIGIAIGRVAILGIPGEPFTEIGRQIKETDGWDMILPTALTNGFDGYFPTKDAYDEGGYEARSSNFKAGVGELIIEESKKLLSELR